MESIIGLVRRLCIVTVDFFDTWTVNNIDTGKWEYDGGCVTWNVRFEVTRLNRFAKYEKHQKQLTLLCIKTDVSI